MARMREVEAEAGLTPAPKADSAAEPPAGAGAAEDAGGQAPPSQEVTCMFEGHMHLCDTALRPGKCLRMCSSAPALSFHAPPHAHVHE